MPGADTHSMEKQKQHRSALSMIGKKQKNLYLSDQARQLLAIFSRTMAISETAVVELLIRDKASRENITLPTDETAKDTPHDST